MSERAQSGEGSIEGMINDPSSGGRSRRGPDGAQRGHVRYVYRDRNLAAYPALNRDPANPDPFFQRRQFGFTLGGPIRRDRVFFFGSWERNEQRGVIDVNLIGTDFAHFSRVTPSPLFGNQLSLRLDGRISNAHTGFVRYSHDGSRAVGPTTFATNAIGPFNGYPSTWARQLAWADQSLLGLTSALRPTSVNDLRFSYFFISSTEAPVAEQDCPGCLGIGVPGIAVGQAGLYIGRSAYLLNLGRRIQFSDSLTWQRGKHRAPETRSKIGTAFTGKPKSPEHRAKLSASKSGEKHPFFGKSLSLEHRTKLRAAAKEREARKRIPGVGL